MRLLRLPDPFLELFEAAELSCRTEPYRDEAPVELEDLAHVWALDLMQNAANHSAVLVHVDLRRLARHPCIYESESLTALRAAGGASNGHIL